MPRFIAVPTVPFAVVGFKLVALLLTVVVGAMMFQLSGPFKAHALNVQTEINATLVDIVNREGNKATLFIPNTDIDFGTAFPGETFQKDFTIYLIGVDNTTWQQPYTSVSYSMTLLAKEGFTDLTPYMTVQRDPIETDNETDSIADGTIGDYVAQGELDAGDTSDKWLVIFHAPDELGYYEADIKIEVP